MRWTEVRSRKPLHLYAGNIYREHAGWVGLSLDRDDDNHVIHDCTWPLPLSDDSVDAYQSEDVFEHIKVSKIGRTLDEIYRVLKPGGLFRWSMPDYRCDVLLARVQTGKFGQIVFDPGGGGSYEGGRVVGGGHVWFPTWEKVNNLIHMSRFSNGSADWRHFYDPVFKAHTNPIDFSLGHIQRVPDHDERVQDPWRPMSLVVDLRK